MSLATLSSPEWLAVDAATQRLVAAKPGSTEFAAALKTYDAAAHALDRADQVASGVVEDVEIVQSLDLVARALRGRVRNCIVIRALAALDREFSKGPA